MQQQDLTTLITELTASLGQPIGGDAANVLQQKIAPMLGNDLRQTITSPVIVTAPVTPPVQPGSGKINITSAFPFSNQILTESPGIFKTLGNRPVTTITEHAVISSIGSGILNNLPVKIPVRPPVQIPVQPPVKIPVNPRPIHLTEIISVFLDTNTTTPALLLPVTITLFGLQLPNQDTHYPVAAGSIWILSKLLCSSAPAGMYTGLTISGGTISFNQELALTNKAITMPAGAVCSLALNLQQPVDTTVSPDNIGIDAMNAKVQLPTQFSFNLTESGIGIVSIAQASWQLYGSVNTFQYDPGQSPIYNPVLNGIYIGCKVSDPTFTVSQCDSTFFTIKGTSPILDGYWELPVAAIDITLANVATGTGSLAVICGTGLQVNWIGLKGGWVNLLLPVLSATVGAIGVTDLFARNRYATQHYDLWSNESTGRLSTLELSYADGFALYFLSLQSGEELLSTSVHFIANIDRPVRVDGNPVSVKGTNGLLYQVYTPASKVFFLYDAALIAENYPPPPNTPLTEAPQEAIALTNGLLTITPAAGVIIYGQLATPNTFTTAKLILSFGLYNLLPALPDPYASNHLIGGLRGDGIAGVPARQPQTTLPLSDVTSLLTGMVSWPQAAADPNAPQLADVSFAIYPLANNTTFGGAQIKQEAVFSPLATQTPAPQQTWDQYTEGFGPAGLSMLDVSTNADLMGVSFSTINIQASSGDNRYVIHPVDNSAETDILQILGMDLATPGKFIRAFTVPEITWEPTINLSEPAIPQDPPGGWLLFGDDGGPTQIFNNSSVVVPIAPIPVSNFIVDSYTNNTANNPLITASLFTLPFGMRSMAVMMNGGAFPAGYQPAALSIEPQDFDITPTGVPNTPKKIVTGGLQITAKGQQDTTQPNTSPSFMGFTMQMRNLLNSAGVATNSSILGPDVDYIFNGEFQPPIIHQVGVPVERIDFSGYGASMFSNWQDPNATIAATSQAKFDVVVGRTSLEIIQVKSLVYPWGIRVVRTITMYRAASALIYRVDSGWRAETDGIYDFSYKDSDGTLIANPYVFHPGVVKGVFNVKNIIDNNLPQFNVQWGRNAGEPYIDPETQVLTTVPAGGVTETVLLQPIYFDADVQIDNVIQGATNGKVPSKQMLGYVQLGPRGEPISPRLFEQLLVSQAGSLGGPVDCIVDIGGSGQQMRLIRVDVSNSIDPAGNIPIFAGTARGTVILPKDGSWSIVQHSQATDSVSAIDNNSAVPLIRIGQLINGGSDYPAQQIRLANPVDLLKDPDNTTINFALLQNTGTQKVLFQLPAYVAGVKQLLSKGNSFPLAKFADAFHLINSTGIFPNPGDIPDMDLSNYGINLVDKGYQLLNKLDPGKQLQQALPSPWYFVNTKDVKLYIEYNATDQQGNAAGNLNYDLDSAAEQWVNNAKNITLNVDLGPFTKMVYINGDFDSSNGSDSAFNTPQLQFGPDLKPVVDILQVLESLSTGDYAAVAKKALEVAMGNSGDNFEYKFHADKEIATLQFPPAELDGPTTPLRLTAGLKVGAYFNEALSITSDPSNLIPSAGAYFEFDGGIQVMCVSLAAATIYAVGQVVVRISADVKTGPSLYMKFGFGVELMVGLPVVGDVSVTYMVGIEMTLSSTEIKITAFLLFKGEASLIGGLVDITITIEASGTIDRTGGSTDMTAQVTFAIDISIFLVINIDFSKSWSESRQIA
ncbi:MAG: hypothetical protein JWP37_136 [Mucilaginibacter sp.]|nr:hypothetical protein [Mucilaginibacter sp.]